MAPFNTHFLIAENIWPQLDGPWQAHYGQFCFGCVAPDVDKLSTALTQKDTHFFDRNGNRELMASHRTATFLQQQQSFLYKPFAQLSPQGQAYVLGYLCHLAVDEVSKYMWNFDTWKYFQDTGPAPAFAALDELARWQTKHYQAIMESLGKIKVLNLIPRIPPTDLESFLHGIHNFVKAETVEGEYLALVDTFSQPTPVQRQQKLQDFQSKIKIARQNVHHFQLDTMLKAGVLRSQQRLTDLIEGRVPEPGYPELCLVA